MGNSRSKVKRSTTSPQTCITSKYDDLQPLTGGSLIPSLNAIDIYNGLNYTGITTFKPASPSTLQTIFSQFNLIQIANILTALLIPPQAISPPYVASFGLTASVLSGQVGADLLPTARITPASPNVLAFTAKEFYGGCPINIIGTGLGPVRCTVVAEGKTLNGGLVQQEFTFAADPILSKRTFDQGFDDLVELKFTITEGGVGGLTAIDTVFEFDNFRHCNKLA